MVAWCCNVYLWMNCIHKSEKQASAFVCKLSIVRTWVGIVSHPWRVVRTLCARSVKGGEGIVSTRMKLLRRPGNMQQRQKWRG
jgi:hypothetical protein